MEDERRLWLTRLRWRLRGAWQAPTFVLATAADGVLLSVLPFSGEGMDLVPAVLLAGFANLAVLGFFAPIGGHFLRRRSPTVPRFVARDRAGTALLLGLVALLMAGGLAHRPAVQEADRDFAAQAEAARRYVAAHAPQSIRANAGVADTVKQGDDFFRTCVPTGEPGRAFCVFVDTERTPPRVWRDRDQSPNAFTLGP